MGQRISHGRKLQEQGSYSRLRTSGDEDQPQPQIQSAKHEPRKLVFPSDCSYRFEHEELWRASAQVLGKGSFGVSYAANLKDGLTVAVKRFKMRDMLTTDFEKLAEKMSSIRHENVAVLRAYCYDKEERVAIYDYFCRGNMHSLLHGKEGNTVVPMNWDDRLNMAIGAARGIVYIHKQEGGKLFHGNLKPSNIFLNSSGQGTVADILFAAMTNHVPQSLATKYQAPEVAVDRRHLSQESDVYSFGVILLELLVRKFEPAPSNGEVRDFIQWGQAVNNYVASGEVFDPVILRNQADILEELLKAFQIGIRCVKISS